MPVRTLLCENIAWLLLRMTVGQAAIKINITLKIGIVADSEMRLRKDFYLTYWSDVSGVNENDVNPFVGGPGWIV